MVLPGEWFTGRPLGVGLVNGKGVRAMAGPGKELGLAGASVRVAAAGWRLGPGLRQGLDPGNHATVDNWAPGAGAGPETGIAGAVAASAGWPGSGKELLRLAEAELLTLKEMGVRLVVWPGYAGSILAQLVTPLNGPVGREYKTEAPGGLVDPRSIQDCAQGPVYGSAVHPIPDLVVSSAQEQAYLAWAANWARRLGVFLVPGSVLVAEGESIYHQAYLLSPDGQVLGRQRQTHLRAAEKAQGLSAGQELLTFPTVVGSIGLVVGNDVWYPEAARILALQGADILVAPITLLTPYPHRRQWAGMWQEVQQNQTFGVECGLEGCLGGLEFHAQTAIMAPCEMTPGQTGYLSGPGSVSSSTLICDLDFSARQAVIANYDILSLLNLELYRRYFPGLYRLPLRNGRGVGS